VHPDVVQGLETTEDDGSIEARRVKRKAGSGGSSGRLRALPRCWGEKRVEGRSYGC
jgi:hypothetical protein